jgi:hypothetical protein
MKRKMIVLALVAALGLTVAAPANAGRQQQQPLNGDMELTLFGEWCGVPFGSPLVSWAGTVVFDGDTYGIAYFPSTPPPDPEEKFFYFEEYWTIFTLDESGVTLEIACDPELVVLDGFDKGRQGPGGSAKADGTVESADPLGPLAGVADESRVFFRGRVTNEAGDEFAATFHILPPK